jgi:plasmid stability protein
MFESPAAVAKTLTLKNLPEALHARLAASAKLHRRSLNSETIASLELADAAAAGLAASQPMQALDRDAALARITELQARFTKTAKQPPQRRTAAELQADLDSFSQLRSASASAPISSEELVAAVGRESHPPDLDSFTTRAQVTP